MQKSKIQYLRYKFQKYYSYRNRNIFSLVGKIEKNLKICILYNFLLTLSNLQRLTFNTIINFESSDNKILNANTPNKNDTLNLKICQIVNNNLPVTKF